MEALIQPADTMQEQESNVKGLHLGPTENKPLNISIERRSKTPTKVSDQTRKDNPSSNKNTEAPPVKKNGDLSSLKIILNFHSIWNNLWLIIQTAHVKLCFWPGALKENNIF